MTPAKKFDVLEARLRLGIAEFDYLDISSVRMDFDLDPPEPVGDPMPRHIARGPRLLVLVPIREDPDARDFRTDPYEHEIESIVGLASACCGRSFAYRKLFDNVLRLKDGSVSAFAVGESPIWHGPPDLSDDAVQILEDASVSIGQLPETDRRRFRLSLRWFSQAVRSDGTDAFLRHWISLEILAMPNTSNIRPLEESLGKAYGLDHSTARNRFKIGRVYQQRNRIVHDGEDTVATPSLNAYMQGVYKDVLCEQLGIAAPKAAEAALSGRASGLFSHYGWT
jgi:hypothetical protein